jgi:hypothetical protein
MAAPQHHQVFMTVTTALALLRLLHGLKREVCVVPAPSVKVLLREQTRVGCLSVAPGPCLCQGADAS